MFVSVTYNLTSFRRNGKEFNLLLQTKNVRILFMIKTGLKWRTLHNQGDSVCV